jgi:hypothetical protein
VPFIVGTFKTLAVPFGSGKSFPTPSGTLRRWCPNTRAHLEGAHADAKECDAQRP